MISSFEAVKPRIIPPLDKNFQPAISVNRAFRQEVERIGVPVILGLERNDGQISRFETLIFPESHPKFISNLSYVERLVKFLLWQRGGYKLYVGGPKSIGESLQKIYSAQGKQTFDYDFMGRQVYEKPFTIIACDASQVPQTHETGERLGRHLEGNRIGFDLGASDRKVSAVVGGKMIYSEEVIWEPRKHSDPEYHYSEIAKAIRTAAGKMPHVDAIGGSSAGIYIDNRPMVASLFRAVPAERYGEIRNLFLRIRDEMQVPLEVINDGDVTALAGSMSIEDNGVLGIALGSSEAVGYVDRNGQIMGWLNELAFAPVDYNAHAPIEEWSGDIGCGASYFSQQCVFRLAPAAGIQIPTDITDADKLKFVQEKLEAGYEGAVQIWRSMGIYLGYALAHYADFYDIKHVLILGRCTSGRGGEIILNQARAVLKSEFPDLVNQFKIHLPDEKIRRVGQSVAAASLPIIEK